MKTLISTLTLFLFCLISMASEIVLIPEIKYKIDIPVNWRVERINKSNAKVVYTVNPSIFLFVKWEKTKSTKSDSCATYTTTTKRSSTTTSNKSVSISTSNEVKLNKSESTKESFNYNTSFIKNGYSIFINCNIDGIDEQTKKELKALIKKIENN